MDHKAVSANAGKAEGPMLDRRAFLAATGALALPAAATAPLVARARDHSPVRHADFSVHRFGVNYVPSRNWYFFWNDFVADDLRRDFDAIASLGMDHMRIMLIWPWFQPNPSFVSPAHLDRLEVVMELAAERHLDVMPAVFTGWLSGFAFRPPFYPPSTPNIAGENFYTSSKWRDAQTLYLEQLASRLMRHTNFLGFDLGNEMNVCWSGPTAEGDPWMRDTFEFLRKIAPGKTHVNGVDHNPYFNDTTFSPRALTTEQPQVVPIHAYPYWTQARKYGGPLDRPYTNLSAAMALLVRSYADDPVRHVWLQEFGVCRYEMPAADVPVWIELAVSAAISQGVSWFTWWGSHDVDRRLQFSEFEYDLGLIDLSGEIKQSGREFKLFAERHRGKRVVFPAAKNIAPPLIQDNDQAWIWMLRSGIM